MICVIVVILNCRFEWQINNQLQYKYSQMSGLGDTQIAKIDLGRSKLGTKRK